MKGDDVRRLQLLIGGAHFADIRVDGVFGKETDTAVRTVEAQLNMTVDGIVDSAFWNAIQDKTKMRTDYTISITKRKSYVQPATISA